MKGKESQPIMIKHQKDWWYQKLKKTPWYQNRPQLEHVSFWFPWPSHFLANARECWLQNFLTEIGIELTLINQHDNSLTHLSEQFSPEQPTSSEKTTIPVIMLLLILILTTTSTSISSTIIIIFHTKCLVRSLATMQVLSCSGSCRDQPRLSRKLHWHGRRRQAHAEYTHYMHLRAESHVSGQNSASISTWMSFLVIISGQ